MLIPGFIYEQRKQEKAREDQLLRDYPDLVSKLVMLLGAGLNCRMAWERIVSDYERSLTRTGGRGTRYAYEEMKTSLKELQLGLAEQQVYENFGSRCNVAAYRRLGTLLAGNLKRGSREMVTLMELEAETAFANRREAVQRKADELGTKLLAPMMVMLCIVIAIVIVPAFRSFSL